MEPNRRRGSKSRLYLSAKRKKQNNIAKFNRDRRAGLPTLTKEIMLGSLIDYDHQENSDEEQQSAQINQEPCITTQTDEIPEPNLDVESSPQKENNGSETIIEGARIVLIQRFFDALKNISNHSPFGCNLSNMNIIKEFKIGFESKFTLKCDMCHFTKIISTWPEHPEKVHINTAAVTAVMNAGGGFTQLKKITGAMDIPTFSSSLYKRVHNKICDAWEKIAWTSMEEAAKEEANIAVACGSVDENGVPMITVACDGSWAKRSYRGGGNYNSLSGVAAIVGFKTQKILYLGVKNKYCSVCQRAENKGQEAPVHTCYKNWNGSSTSMEASIIAEGFCSSLEMHNLIFNKMIADGDSSCYKKILDSRPYQNITVQKIECINHLLRNYCNKLKDISKSKGIPGVLRNVIQKNVLRCRSAVVKAVQYRREEKATNEEAKIRNLRIDILNSLSHIFGEHKNCSQIKYFCLKTEPDKENFMNDFCHLGLEEKIMDAVRQLARHSRSLLEYVTTNTVEQFNAIIAEKIGGKRVNYTMRRSYQGRCFSAVVSRNTKRPLYTMHKFLSGGFSPSTNIKKLEKKSMRKKNLDIARKKLKFSNRDPDASYGENCEKPDLDPETYEEIKSDFLKSLKKSDAEFQALEENTRLQADSAEWHQYRKKLLTASIFGKICKMRPTTSCSSAVKGILYKEFFSRATSWGKNNEERALRHLEEKLGTKIQNCGLFVNKNWPYLGSSPDGVIENTNDIVEIKCPFTARNSTIKEGILNKTIDYLTEDGDQYFLKKSHNYYYQIQGQLNISSKEKCCFSIWTLKDMVFMKIPIDKEFFETKMVPKLEKFYFNCLLPEIVDPRHTRNLAIRDPDYIQKHEKNNKKPS